MNHTKNQPQIVLYCNELCRKLFTLLICLGFVLLFDTENQPQIVLYYNELCRKLFKLLTCLGSVFVDAAACAVKHFETFVCQSVYQSENALLHSRLRIEGDSCRATNPGARAAKDTLETSDFESIFSCSTSGS